MIGVSVSIGLLTGDVQTSNGSTFPVTVLRMKFVATDENHDWLSDGARNPVLTAPRRISGLAGV